MIKDESAINFYQGKICIRSGDGKLTFQDASCIPIIKDKIDKYIEDNPKSFSVKEIIYSVIKEHFSVTKKFVPPNETSYIPTNDTLYMDFVSHITNNPIYSERLSKRKANFSTQKAITKKNKFKEQSYDSYVRTRHNLYIKYKRYHK